MLSIQMYFLRQRAPFTSYIRVNVSNEAYTHQNSKLKTGKRRVQLRCFALACSHDELVLAHLPCWLKAWPTPDFSCGWQHPGPVDELLLAMSGDRQALTALLNN
eukprot:1079938-Amphidinium_carterae.1